jgi:hypothetical protein
LAWQLQQAGYTVELDVWDWAPGGDFVARMSAALERADRLLAVCTEAYFTSAFGGAQLRAAFVGQAKAEGRIVPVLVEPVSLPAVRAADPRGPERPGRGHRGGPAAGPPRRGTPDRPATVPPGGT